MSRQAEDSRARAAGMARATYGRNTRWKATRAVFAAQEALDCQEAISEALEATRATENRYCGCRQATQAHKVTRSNGVTFYTCPCCGSVKS